MAVVKKPDPVTILEGEDHAVKRNLLMSEKLVQTKMENWREILMSDKKTTFLGLHIPKGLSMALSIDAKKHFRQKNQHILWICNQYLFGIGDPIAKPSAKDINERINKMKRNFKQRESEAK